MELWFSEFHTPDVKFSLRVNKQLYSKQSDYQRIDVLDTAEFGRVLVLDGNIMLTERDEFIYDEMIVHVPMAVHPGIKNVLVIGAGDGGVVRELTRFEQVENIDQPVQRFVFLVIRHNTRVVGKKYIPRLDSPGSSPAPRRPRSSAIPGSAGR